MVFIVKNKGKLSRNFYFSPFFRYLVFSRPTPRNRKKSWTQHRFCCVFAPPRFNQNAAWCLCFVKISAPKLSQPNLGRNKVPTTNRKWSQLTTIFAPPRCHQNAAWRQCFAKISVPKIFADRPWKKKVPTTNRECNEFTIIFAPPRCDQNAAWRLCFARISAPNIFADHPWKKKVPTTNREFVQFTIVFGPPALRSKRCAVPMPC